MLRIKPFRAIRPISNLAPDVASVPYDVVSTSEARRLAEGRPHSFLRVVRSEIELPEGTDPYADAVYERAAANLRGLLDRGILVQERQPHLYLYRQVMQHHTQIGLVCCCHVDDYANDLIRKHEKTRRVKEDDRTRHVLAVNANTGPVFLTYRDRPEIDRLVHEAVNQRPMFHFDAPDRVTHTGWEIADAEPFVRAFRDVPAAYVADGHHRAASAYRAGCERRSANPGHTGDEEYNWFLVALFPASQLRILSYNRIVRDLGGKSPSAVLDELGRVGALAPTDRPAPERPATFCIYLDGTWHRLELEPDSIDRNDPVGSLDAALLQDRVLAPVLGVGDPRSDDRIDFVGGIRGTAELERLVDAGEAGIAFSLHHTTIEQLLAVADAGLIMPPKSTWFEPKLRSGLFVHALD